jgi:hypothetical protein
VFVQPAVTDDTPCCEDGYTVEPESDTAGDLQPGDHVELSDFDDGVSASATYLSPTAIKVFARARDQMAWQTGIERRAAAYFGREPLWRKQTRASGALRAAEGQRQLLGRR